MQAYQKQNSMETSLKPTEIKEALVKFLVIQSQNER